MCVMSIEVVNPSGILRDITQHERSIRKLLGKVLTKATLRLKRKVRSNVSLTDHTLFDMAVLGHPYGLEGGPAESWDSAKGKKSRQNLHSPNYLIHKHSDAFVNALYHRVVIEERMGFLGGDIMSGIVGFDEDKCEYARYVIMGTRKMVSRDVLTESLNELRDKLAADILK